MQAMFQVVGTGEDGATVPAPEYCETPLIHLVKGNSTNRYTARCDNIMWTEGEAVP